jgi:predicted signal transduction protein with EAL and GGDEF domain
VSDERPSSAGWALVAAAWLLVGLPLLWGVLTTLRKALLLFR